MSVFSRSLVIGCLLVLVPAVRGQGMLLAHWPFDDLAGAGVSESVQGITETVVGADVRVPGPFGTALQCDGSSTYFDTAVYQVPWSYLNSFTVVCWLQPGQGQATWVPIMDQHNVTQNMGLFVGLSVSNGAHLAVGNGSTWQCLCIGPTVTAGVWTHCAFVFDSASVNGELKCYINGVLLLTTNVPGGPMQDPRGSVQMRIGARVDNTGFLNAAIDDLAIYDDVLTLNTIADVMANGVPLFPEYQTNSWRASFSVDGVQGTQLAAATVTIPVGAQATLGFSSFNLGQPWDLGSGVAPLVPTSAGGLLSSDGQVVNLDVTDPTLSTWFNFLQGPNWGPLLALSIPFSVPVAASVSAQMIVASPSLPSGVALSQPVRLVVQ